MAKTKAAEIKSKETKKPKTPSFVVEIPLQVDSCQDAQLFSRFEAARQLYNGCLSESRTRMQLVKASSLYLQASQNPRDQKQTRKVAFAAARNAYRYTEYELQKFAATMATSCWIGEHLGSKLVQTIATRAFKATERLLFGQANKVRFKGKDRLHSIENKTNEESLRWKNNKVLWPAPRESKLSDIVLNPIIDQKDEVLTYALTCRTKYVRIVKRNLNGKRRWSVQLICSGVPFHKSKNRLGDGLIGLDLGPSTVALVGDNWASLVPFCSELADKSTTITKLQRQLARSSRMNNPDNYEPDFIKRKQGQKPKRKKGKVKKGSKQWKNSRRYLKLRAKKAEIERRLAASRKSLQGRLVNQVLSQGKHVKMEKVSLKAWQKLWGKSIGRKAPGMFQSELIRKAEGAGGSALQFSTRKTALSQVCLCGRKQKKPLSQRVHQCPCGIQMQRDLFSAFLSRYVDAQTELLSCESARDGWLRLEPIVRTAWQQASNLTCEQVSASERTSVTGSERVVRKLIAASQTKTDGHAEASAVNSIEPPSL